MYLCLGKVSGRRAVPGARTGREAAAARSPIPPGKDPQLLSEKGRGKMVLTVFLRTDE